MTSLNFALHADAIIPVAGPDNIVTGMSLIVRAGLIDGFIATDDARQILDIEHIELPGHTLMPGLVNAHGHAAMTLLRGYADDMPLDRWLNEKIWPMEGKWVAPDFVRDGTEIAAAEMILSGITTTSDMYFFPDVAAQALRSAGMRTQVVFPIMNVPTAWASDAREYLDKGLALRDHFRNDDLVDVGLGPHSTYTVDEALLSITATLANELDAAVQIHLHETAAEVLAHVEATGERPTDLLARIGLLGPRTQCVHMTDIGNQDIDTLVLHGAHVIHCPRSNMKLASGACPVAKLKAAGVNVALGTDGAASNNKLNGLAEMQAASLLAKLESGDPTALSAADSIKAATLDGARAMGLDAVTGSLEVGKSADIIAVDTTGVTMTPGHRLDSDIVYASSGTEVAWSWIAGNNVLKNRQLQTLDSEALTDKARAWRAKLSA
ncbi:MAG: TRZ/ATZ family hydrolase [Gammaproteobacteria bacterium]